MPDKIYAFKSLDEVILASDPLNPGIGDVEYTRSDLMDKVCNWQQIIDLTPHATRRQMWRGCDKAHVLGSENYCPNCGGTVEIVELDP